MNLNGTVTVQEGESINITCFSSGNPIPTITWYLGLSLAPFSQNDSVEDYQAEIVGTFPNDMFSFTEGNITSVLRIENAVYPAHDGEYTCVGLNSHRAVDNTNNATITVQVQGMRVVVCTVLNIELSVFCNTACRHVEWNPSTRTPSGSPLCVLNIEGIYNSGNSCRHGKDVDDDVTFSDLSIAAQCQGRLVQ